MCGMPIFPSADFPLNHFAQEYLLDFRSTEECAA